MSESFVYVDSKSMLIKSCRELSSKKEIGVDIECENNFHHYGVYISIIQVSTRDKNYVFDVLRLGKIGPLAKVLENPNIVKVFHNVDFDLRILGTQFGCRPKNLFDTQIAASLLGKENIGLADLLEEYFGVEKKKKFQRADWTKRPIRREMLKYAVKDSSYLLNLKDKLEKELAEKDRLKWAKDEFKNIEDKEWEYPEFTYRDVKGYRSLNDRQRAILKELFRVRERLAKKVDRPVHFIFSNRKIVDLARGRHYSVNFWKNIRRTHPVVRNRAVSFAKAFRRGSKGKIVIKRKKRKGHTEKQKTQIKRLNILREDLAKKYDIKPHLILSKDDIKNAVHSQSLSCLKRWQKNIVEKHFSFD